MSRTWAELLGDAGGAADEEERGGFLARLRDSLGKSRRALVAELGASFDPAEEDAWEQLEVAPLHNLFAVEMDTVERMGAVSLLSLIHI